MKTLFTNLTLLLCLSTFAYGRGDDRQSGRTCEPRQIVRSAQEALDKAYQARGREENKILSDALIELRDNCDREARKEAGNSRPNPPSKPRNCSYGTVLDVNGSAFYADVGMNQYLGRASGGAQFELLSNQRFTNTKYPNPATDWVYVRIVSNEYKDEIGKVGYIGADDTDLVTKGCIPAGL